MRQTTVPSTHHSPRRRPSLGLRDVMSCVAAENRDELNGIPFNVVRDTLRPWSATAPLVIVIHPGDAVEPPCTWPIKDRHKVVSVSKAMQTGMAQELEAARKARADTVVLHRQSSELVLRDQNADWQVAAYRNEVQQLGRSEALLYGDDLDAAAQWIIDHVPLSDRPSVFFTGAYSHQDFGCITAVGKKVQERFPHLVMTVSTYAPSSAINDEPHWVPAAPQPRTLNALPVNVPEGRPTASSSSFHRSRSPR